MDQSITMMTQEETTEVGPNDIVIHLVNPYKCGNCELEFLEKALFKDHMFTHLEQIKQERPSSQMVMTIVLPPETPGGVTVTRDILQLGEDGSIKQVPQPPSNITLNQVQPLRELEEAGVIKLDQPKPTNLITRDAAADSGGSITTDGQGLVPQELMPVVTPGQSTLGQARAGLIGQSLLKDSLVKSTGGEDASDGNVSVGNSAFIPNKDGTFSFAFKGANEEMQHIQIIRSDGIKTEVLMELGAENKPGNLRQTGLRGPAMRLGSRLAGAKTNECDLCGKVLSSSTNLLRHKMYHSAERPFVCDVCNKGFKDISNLKKHTLIHKRIFPCHLCKKSFLRKSLLDVHLRRHESRTTFVKTGNSTKEVTMRTFVDMDGTRVEEMSMTALGGQTFEYKSRIVKADGAGANKDQTKIEDAGVGDGDPDSSVLDSSAAVDSILETSSEVSEGSKQNPQSENERPATDKMFTVTMEGLQETSTPVAPVNGEQQASVQDVSVEEQSADDRFPPLPEDFVKVYQCGHCGKRTVQRGNMMRHLIHHLKDKPFACDECPKRFVDKGELFKHKKTHTKPYRCPQCNGAFAHNVQLVKHLEKECLGSFGQLNYTVMEDGQTYKCDICGVEMKRLGNMIKHVGTHTTGHRGKKLSLTSPKPAPGKPDAPYFYDSAQRAFFCGFCPRSFWKKASVHRHIQVHMRDGDHFKKHALVESKPHKCDLCPLAFSRKLFLETHKRKHNGSELPTETADYGLLEDMSGYYCKHCDTKLPKKYSMMSHVKKHTSERIHECSTCNKCFSAVHLLMKHKKIHKKVLVCKRCGETFSQKFALVQHIRKRHPVQERRFPSENFPTASQIPYEPKDEGNVTYPCAYCNAPFARMVIKMNHEKKCREESKVVERMADGSGFRCRICGKMATLKHNLMAHVRKHESVKIIDMGGKIVVSGDQNEQDTVSTPKPASNSTDASTATKKISRKRRLSPARSESDSNVETFVMEDDDSPVEEEELEEDEDNRYKRTPGGFACVQCRRKFTDRDTLTRHLESHITGKDENMSSGRKDDTEANGKKGEVDNIRESADDIIIPPQDGDVDAEVSTVSGDLPDVTKVKAEEATSPISSGQTKHKSVTTPATKKIKQEKDQMSPITSTPRTGGRPARAQKIPSRFLE